jgi:carbonic anhydrase
VVGHHDCGMTKMEPAAILDQARGAGIDAKALAMLAHAGIDLEGWLTGFESPAAGVRASVKLIGNHPLLPEYVLVHGLLMDPGTGELEVLDGAVGEAQRAR